MTPCREWSGRKSKDGYGERFYKGKKRLAHRVAFFEKHGYWPKEVAHKCHNRACIRPSHLKDATHTENVRESPATKLTLEQVEEIRRNYTGARGERIAIMRAYDISSSQFGRIKRGESWK
jgi:hypothetical protein